MHCAQIVDESRMLRCRGLVLVHNHMFFGLLKFSCIATLMNIGVECVDGGGKIATGVPWVRHKSTSAMIRLEIPGNPPNHSSLS